MTVEQNLVATSILDFEHPVLRSLAQEVGVSITPHPDYLRSCHTAITKRVSPIYTVDELQPASVTLRKGRGSCSQRMAVLEALARAGGIATQVRVLWVSGRFWYPRFSALLRAFIPSRILLLWPQFWLEGRWVGIEEIHGPLQQLASSGKESFQNNGETLFEAVSHTPVDFAGVTCAACGDRYDLSHFVLQEEEPAAARDEALSRYHLFQRTLRGHMFELLFAGKPSH